MLISHDQSSSGLVPEKVAGSLRQDLVEDEDEVGFLRKEERSWRTLMKTCMLT